MAASRSAVKFVTAVFCLSILGQTTTYSSRFEHSAGESPIAILATGDTEGHINPCQSCPLHLGFGGMARRATLIRRLRGQSPLLLFDAGNAMFGAESFQSRGQIIAEAMTRLKYDAINISYRDFRLGKSQTVSVIERSGLRAISANILEAENTRLLFAPFVVCRCGGVRIAIIGLTQFPEHLDLLPNLRDELRGVRILPPLEALNRHLPQALQSSDALIVLYYGSARSLNEVLPRLGQSVIAVIAAGAEPNELLPPGPDRPPVFIPEPHGKSLVKLILSEQLPAEHLAVSGTQLPVAPTLPADPAMQLWLDSYQPR